jgi:Zn-dependent protease with chaperone function
MLEANYFDGRSSRIRTVNLSIVGTDLCIVGAGIDLRVAFADVAVDERLGRAPRRLRLPGGVFCEVRDLESLDALLIAAGNRDGRVDRFQRRAQFVLLSCLAFVCLAVAGYEWGLPWAAEQGAKRIPPAIEEALAVQTQTALDGSLLKPSQLAVQRRLDLTVKFHALRLPQGGNADSVLVFRRSPQIGANAFTLPDGTIIILDELISLVGDDQQILAALAHELGHARAHHAMQLLLRSSAVGAFWAFYIGDISALLAAAPTALLQARYSKEFEQQADDYAASLLFANGMSPALLADALNKLMQQRPALSKGGYLSTHPATDERIKHLRMLAAHSMGH